LDPSVITIATSIVTAIIHVFIFLPQLSSLSQSILISTFLAMLVPPSSLFLIALSASAIT
jgi:hypothetical protein